MQVLGASQPNSACVILCQKFIEKSFPKVGEWGLPCWTLLLYSTPSCNHQPTEVVEAVGYRRSLEFLAAPAVPKASTNYRVEEICVRRASHHHLAENVRRIPHGRGEMIFLSWLWRWYPKADFALTLSQQKAQEQKYVVKSLCCSFPFFSK